MAIVYHKNQGGEENANLPISGPISRGIEYVKKGIKLKDIPYIASKMGSEFFGGIPEMASRKPLISSMAGPLGATGGKEEGVDYFPKSVSEGGKVAGSELGLASGMLDPALALSAPLKQVIAKPVQKLGVRIMQGILKPKGELAEKGTQIAERALWEGLKGSKEGMLKRAYSLLQEGGKEIGDIITKNKGKNIDIDIVFKELNDLKKKYAFAQNEKKVEAINTLIEKFRPTFKEQKTITSAKRVGGEFNKMTGEYTPITKRVKQTRTVRRDVPIEEAQARKVAQYQDIAEGRGYPLETTSPEIAGRKSYARGFMKATEKVAPEISRPNKRFGGVSEIAQALEERLPTEQRQNLLGLGDIILGAAGTISPQALTAGLTRKALQWTPITSRIAQGAYRFGRKPPSLASVYPLLRYFQGQENQ